jgi:hypothetical protein
VDDPRSQAAAWRALAGRGWGWLAWRLPVPGRAPPRRTALSDNLSHPREPHVNRTTPIRFSSQDHLPPAPQPQPVPPPVREPQPAPPPPRGPATRAPTPAGSAIRNTPAGPAAPCHPPARRRPIRVTTRQRRTNPNSSPIRPSVPTRYPRRIPSRPPLTRRLTIGLALTSYSDISLKCRRRHRTIKKEVTRHARRAQARYAR